MRTASGSLQGRKSGLGRSKGVMTADLRFIVSKTVAEQILLQINIYATLAQLVEHLIRNEEVAGSIPVGGSTSSTTLGLLIFAK